MARMAADGRFEVRKSKVHGRGVFALKRIRKGTRLIEYLGQRVSHEEADRRYADKDARDSHTFLFTVDARTVIDAGVDGNDSRFFNHSCDPNCESIIEDKRVWIEVLRTIEPGDELTYDYQIVRDDNDPPYIDEVFACRCGARECRGTMLWSKEEQKAKEREQALKARQEEKLAKEKLKEKQAKKAKKKPLTRAGAPKRAASPRGPRGDRQASRVVARGARRQVRRAQPRSGTARRKAARR